MREITEILQRSNLGSEEAVRELMPLLYAELRRIAGSLLSQKPPGQTLQPTALVHEAYVRLVGTENPTWETRQQFFSAAARAMRNILVDEARRKAALKRGGDRDRVGLDDVQIDPPDEDMVALDEALDRLEAKDPRMSRIVMLRYFAGLTEAESAEVLDISRATLARDWQFARRWLYGELRGD